MKLKDNNGILEVPEDPKFLPDPRGFGAHCFYNMKKFSKNIAQINADTNQTDTYEEILIKSIRVALKLQNMGLKKGDIISLCSDNHSETCLPFWAAHFTGIIGANLDVTFSLSDLKHLINLTKPKVIFSIPETVKNLEIVIKELNLNTKLVVFGETSTHLPFKDFLQPQNGEENFEPKVADDLNDTMSIFFSSGTTGLPKGVCGTHYGILNTIYLFKNILVKEAETFLYYTSPYWISYATLTAICVLFGGKRIIAREYNPRKYLQYVQDYKVTYSFLAPTLAFGVTSLPGITSNSYDTSSLQYMTLGGGNYGIETMHKLRKLFPHTCFSTCYGSTDTQGLFCGFDPDTDKKEMETKLLSSGKMMPGTIAKVVDIETGEVLGKNKQGELLIKAKRNMKEYYKDPEKTAEQFDEEGYLRTGDVVYYDDDYFFYIVNRTKEMFKYKSWHIIPLELEEILVKHPAVKEVLVIGYPHEEDGDHPMAVIIPEEGTKVTENEILQYFNEQVSDRKKLRGGVRFIKSFPKTATGKYSRIKLRSMIINNEI